MRNRLVLLSAIAMYGGCIGCASEAPEADDALAAPSADLAQIGYVGTVATTADGTKMVGDAVAIDVWKGNDRVEMSVLAHASKQLITAMIRIDPALIKRGGSAVAQIAQIPLDPGIAWVERQRANAAPVRAKSGTITYTLASRAVSMTISGDTADVSAVVSGSFQVRCWVPPEDLGQQQSVNVENGKQLLLDQHFKSSYCAQFKP